VLDFAPRKNGPLQVYPESATPLTWQDVLVAVREADVAKAGVLPRLNPRSYRENTLDRQPGALLVNW
jgi:hypothetical protein